MKKALIIILIILLTVLAYFAIFKGISIGNFRVLSVTEIQNANDNLTEEIAQTETLIHSTYVAQTEQLEKSIDTLLSAEEEYLDLASVSTDGELTEASKQEIYKIEFLWAKIGNYATSEGVTLKLDVTAGETGEADVKNLSFTTTGRYTSIVRFVTELEDDSDLGFRIQNFKMLPGTDASARQATFVVKNVRIKQEVTTTNPTTTEETSVTDTTNTTNNNTNTTNTTNGTENTTDTNSANNTTTDTTNNTETTTNDTTGTESTATEE